MKKGILIELNCSTEKELFSKLGLVLAARKLLKDYFNDVGKPGIGPERYAENWIKRNIHGGKKVKDELITLFVSMLQAVGNG